MDDLWCKLNLFKDNNCDFVYSIKHDDKYLIFIPFSIYIIKFLTIKPTLSACVRFKPLHGIFCHMRSF